MRRSDENHPEVASSSRSAIAVLTGITCALLTASLVCRPPDPRSSSGKTLLLTAFGYCAVTASGGLIGLWLALPTKRYASAFGLSRFFLAAWLFLPAAVLLFREYSTLALAPSVLAGSALAIAWIQAYPQATCLEPPTHQANDMIELFATLPTRSSHFGTALSVSVLMYSCAVALCGGWLSLAGYLVAFTAFLLTLQRAEPVISTEETRPGSKRRKLSLIYLGSLAVAMTILALLPTLQVDKTRSLAMLQSWIQSLQQVRPQTAKPHDKLSSSSGYVGVVLWPSRKRKQIEVPVPRAASDTFTQRRTLVIPFDGPYLYSRVPGERPGPAAHVAQGTPLSVHVASSDTEPIFMQADQQLGSSLEVACCSAIEVALENSEQAGPLSFGLVLTDGASPSKTIRFLGMQTVAPGQQSVTFLLPHDGKLERFDQLRVLIVEPSGPRSRQGAKVAIEQFTLLPR
jgi:hypothetical protein